MFKVLKEYMYSHQWHDGCFSWSGSIFHRGYQR